MSTSGMARKVDDLGRIVLPVEMRRLFGIQAGDALEIAVEDRGIVLRKVETRCVFCSGNEALRSHRGKQLCSSCAAELGAPAASEVAEAEASRAQPFEGLPPPAELDGQRPPPTELSAAAGELDHELAAARAVERLLPSTEPQRDVVDAPPWES
jgi:transcriptional pleiotropic regulator of transition state genes